MQNIIYKEDNGIDFGKWSDNTSKLMYFDSVKDILSKIDTKGKIADYGGANGILKQFIPNIISIDIDASKNPDIVDNILTHNGNYDLIIIRFVLHYLNDYEVLKLFKNIEKYHKGKILIIQFTNEDLKSKYYNSKNEFKYFRTKNQLQKLLPKFKNIYSIKYECSIEFYKNRLNIENAKNHIEEINAYLI
jgi:hypothetical protein